MIHLSVNEQHSFFSISDTLQISDAIANEILTFFIKVYQPIKNHRFEGFVIRNVIS
jgi:hypothetical protein